MPDDDVAGGAAVATEEPSSPTVETPTELPDEAVPTPEQEPSEGEKPEDESGAPEKEDEAEPPDISKALLDLIEEAEQSDPKLAEELRNKFAPPPEKLEDERLRWQVEKARSQRQERLSQVVNAYSQYEPSRAQQVLVNVFAEMNNRVREAAKQLHEGKIEDPNDLQIDPQGWAQLVAPLVTGGQAAMRDWALGWAQSTVFDTLEDHPSHRHLSAEERTKYEGALQQGDFQEALRLHLDAGMRSAPEEVARQAKEKATKDAGLLEKFEQLRSVLGKNGKPMSGAAPAKGGEPRTLDEVNEALMNPDTPLDQLPVLQKKRQQLLGM